MGDRQADYLHQDKGHPKKCLPRRCFLVFSRLWANWENGGKILQFDIFCRGPKHELGERRYGFNVDSVYTDPEHYPRAVTGKVCCHVYARIIALHIQDPCFVYKRIGTPCPEDKPDNNSPAPKPQPNHCCPNNIPPPLNWIQGQGG